MDSNATGLLRAILSTVARQTFPPSTILKIVAPQANSGKWIKVYNFCDGTRVQAEIAKEGKVDPSDLSKKLGRWIEEGIIIRLTDGTTETPIHVYPLPNVITDGVK
jgi:hypothetical protein